MTATPVRSALLAACLVLFPLLQSGPASADEAARLIKLLADGNHIALMRHAMAPGTFDPPGFSLEDCTTQRNLSGEGREQATAVGARLRAGGLRAATVYSSRHCRTKDTAALLGYGAVAELPEIFAFSPGTPKAEQQTTELRAWIARQPRAGAIILVTHSFNISALTGLFPSEAEIIVLRREPDGMLAVEGRMK